MDDGIPWDMQYNTIPTIQRVYFPSSLVFFMSVLGAFFVAAVFTSLRRGPNGVVKADEWL